MESQYSLCRQFASEVILGEPLLGHIKVIAGQMSNPRPGERFKPPKGSCALKVSKTRFEAFYSQVSNMYSKNSPPKGV